LKKLQNQQQKALRIKMDRLRVVKAEGQFEATHFPDGADIEMSREGLIDRITQGLPSLRTEELNEVVHYIDLLTDGAESEHA
jgi:hypothetical protein